MTIAHWVVLQPPHHNPHSQSVRRRPMLTDPCMDKKTSATQQRPRKTHALCSPCATVSGCTYYDDKYQHNISRVHALSRINPTNSVHVHVLRNKLVCTHHISTKLPCQSSICGLRAPSEITNDLAPICCQISIPVPKCFCHSVPVISRSSSAPAKASQGTAGQHERRRATQRNTQG